MANKRQLIIEVVGDASRLNKSFKQAQVSVSGFDRTVGTSLRSIAKLTAAIGGVAAATAGIKSVVSSASDLNEQVNKAAVVFGVASADVEAWSKTTASAFGLSQRAALEAAGSFGQILETSGLSATEAAKLSKRIVELASDLASFNNIDPQEALDKLRSGLSGEAEPLRRVGVLLSEARVQQEAYRSGLAKVGTKLTEAQKVQARYALILKDTATAQGDFGRTSDSLANRLRIFQAQLENLQGQLGMTLLPIVNAAVGALNNLVEGFSRANGVRAKVSFVIDGVQNLGDQLLAQIDAQSIAATLNRADWGALGRSAGQGIVRGFRAASTYLAAVDWGFVGRQIVNGIAAFLSGVDWGSVASAQLKLLVAVLKAQQDLLVSAGKALAGALYSGIKSGLDNLGLAAKRLAYKVVIKILEPFNVKPLGRAIVPGMNALINGMKNKLAEMEDEAKAGSARVAAALAGSSSPLGRQNRSAAVTTAARTTASTGGSTGASGGGRTGTTASQRNQWFDAGIARLLDRVQDVGTIGGQITALKKIATLIQARIAATKDVTRKLNLEDQLVAVNRQSKGLREQQQQNLADAIQKQQYAALGLSATGGELPPSAKALVSQFSRVSKAVEGSFLNTGKTKSLLSKIRKVFAKGLDDLTVDTRTKIRELLDGIDQDLKDRASGPRTRTTSLADVVGAAFSGLDLTRAQQRTLSRRFSSFNSAGVGLTGSVATTPAFANYVTVEIDGRKIEASVTKQQQKRARRTPTKRRGR